MTHNYVGDDVVLKTEFTIDGVAQIPLTGTVKIIKCDNSVVVNEGTAIDGVSGTVASFTFANATEGDHVIFWTLDFGADKRTRAVHFRIVTKDFENIDG